MTSRFVVAALLMIVCAAAIGRLLWLMEGKPPLDRPRWVGRLRSRRGRTELDVIDAEELDRHGIAPSRLPPHERAGDARSTGTVERPARAARDGAALLLALVTR